MIIKVTANDIKNSRKSIRDCKKSNGNIKGYCPIEISIRRRFKNIKVRVKSEYLEYYDSKNRIGLCCNDKMQDFIGKFDTFRPVKPFSFDLNKLERLSVRTN